MRKFYVNGFETEIKSGNKPCYIEKNGMKYIEDEDGTLTLAPFNVTEKCE